jgi:hypothetical protein
MDSGWKWIWHWVPLFITSLAFTMVWSPLDRSCLDPWHTVATDSLTDPVFKSSLIGVLLTQTPLLVWSFAAGLHQHSHFWFRALWCTWTYFSFSGILSHGTPPAGSRMLLFIAFLWTAQATNTASNSSPTVVHIFLATDEVHHDTA